jgi:hypothetical protein
LLARAVNTLSSDSVSSILVNINVKCTLR